MSFRRYTQKEIKFIEDNYRGLSPREIAEEIGRSEKGIRNKIKRLGFSLSDLKRGQWTTEELDFVKQHANLSDEEISRKINRTVSAICAKRCRFGLFKRRRLKNGDVYLDVDGYYKIKTSGGRCFYHIFVKERELGRKITKIEKVHHINFDKTDNRKENLFVCRDRSHHFTIHFQAMGLLGELVNKNIIKFDKKKGCYYL
uniref:Putative homing endonuclease n=1 Tax=viral metagenome TaxID=1070528 RepID=A0A6M3M720_9ZZZZ